MVITSAGPASLDSTALVSIVAATKPGGQVEVRELVWRGSPADASNPRVRALRDGEGVKKALLFAGLSGATAPEVQPVALAGVPPAQLVGALYPELAASAAKGSGEAADALAAIGVQLVPMLAVCVLHASKPSYTSGASFSLRSRAQVAAKPTAPAPAVAPPATSAPSAGSAWASLGSAPAGDEADLLDEDSLLDAEDLKKKQAEQMDCGTDNGTGKRKACKNCSCGLKEMLENEEGEMVEVPTQKSSCGNCSLGDAYRCAGCPHLGKPAFAPGEELKLADSMLKSDAAMPTAPPPLTAGTKLGGAPKLGGVVKLGLDDTMDDF